MTTISSESKPIVASRRITLRGCVQGLGIRPTVARRARALGLGGSVRNEMSGVIIEVSGDVDSLERFVRELRHNLPSGAAVTQIESDSDANHCESFQIEASHESGPTRTIVPTDRVVCEACLSEVQTPGNRRFAYPFTSCTDCGPRYSILRSMPYDRVRTSMSAFVMCDWCRMEYENPRNRRFHSQTNCCPACGPRLWSTDAQGGLMKTEPTALAAGVQRDANQLLRPEASAYGSRSKGFSSAHPQGNQTLVDQEAMQAAIETLRAGQIVAIKGVGGYQLICDATSEGAVALLRERKRRPSKPLAVMVRDVDEAEELAHLSDIERESLCSAAGPIVIARSKPNSILAQATNGALSDIGVMLPTSPLHFVLLEGAGVPLIVTSGNIDGEPLEYREEEAEKRLASVADRFLHHDREIVRPIDDSVVRCIADRVVTIRAARGIAPLPLDLNLSSSAIASGGQQKVAVAISNGHQAVLGPHIGDLDSVASRERLADQTESICQLYGCAAGVIAHDSHHDYWTLPHDAAQGRKSTQHHHAHVVSAMVEHRWLDKTVLGIAFDGTGLGTDETIWGGEILVASAKGFKRVGHLRPFPLAGGEAAIRDPSRVAIALIQDALGKNSTGAFDWIGIDIARRDAIAMLLHSPRLSPITSSVGRLFDGVAAMTLSDWRCSFEGEPAMLLEAACDSTDPTAYEISLTGEVPSQLDWRPMIHQLLDDRRRGVAAGKMAMRFHRGLAKAVVQMIQQFPELPVVFSGGVFQNRVLVELIVDSIHKHHPIGLPGLIPPNDGGLAVGQLAIAATIATQTRRQPCA